MDKGQLVYEYNMMIIERYIGRSTDKLAAGKHKIEVDTKIAKPGAPADCRSEGRRGRGRAAHGQAHCAGGVHRERVFNVGVDLGSPVSLDYFDRRPFPFSGKIETVTVELK